MVGNLIVVRTDAFMLGFLHQGAVLQKNVCISFASH